MQIHSLPAGGAYEQQVLPSPQVFPRNWATLNTAAKGWSAPNNVILYSPWNANFTGGTSPKKRVFYPPERDFYQGTPSKRDWASFE